MADPVLDTSIMTHTLEKILGIFEVGAGTLGAGGAGLLSVLITIEIVWGGIMWSFLDANGAFRQFLRKIVLVGIFAFIVLNWTTVANTILDGFVWAGAEVGGGHVPISLMRDPSQILDLGMAATTNIWKQIGEVSLLESGTIGLMLLMGIVGFVTLILYFLIAMQVYMTLLEFYIITAFGTIFIPWGVNSHTKWIAERYLGAIVAQGTKLMVLSALVATVFPVLKALHLPEEPSWYQAISLMFGTGTIAFVVMRAPQMAGGLMAGSATLDAADAMSTAKTVGTAGAAVAVSAGSAAATGGATAGAGLATSAGAVAKAAGSVASGSGGGGANGSVGSGGSAAESGSSVTD
jgi:type IV secretion system protein TrbL